jgi:hypothetical protein
MSEPIPILILAGSDRRQGPVHPELSPQDMLSGFKGAIPLPWGKCIAAELINRYRKSGRFADPLLIGPRSVYDGLVDCEIIDVDGTLVDSLRFAQQRISTRFPNSAPVAVSACDILPTPQEIRELLEGSYDAHRDCHFWWQMITAEPEELGASSWKPRYAIQGQPGEVPRTAYPGHLVIYRPDAVRTDLLIRLLTLAYRYRNRPLRKRALPMLIRGVGMMAMQDFRNLAAGQLPLLTFSIPWHVMRAYSEFRHQALTRAALERHLGRILLHRGYRRNHRPVVVALSRNLAFAQDVDTQAELDAVIAQGEIVG